MGKPGRPSEYPHKYLVGFDSELNRKLDESIKATKKTRTELIRECVRKYLGIADKVLVQHECRFCGKNIDPGSDDSGFAGVFEQDYDKARRGRHRSPKAHFKAPWFTAHWDCFYNDESGKNLILEVNTSELRSRDEILNFIANLRAKESDWVFLTDWQGFLRKL